MQRLIKHHLGCRWRHSQRWPDTEAPPFQTLCDITGEQQEAGSSWRSSLEDTFCQAPSVSRCAPCHCEVQKALLSCLPAPLSFPLVNVCPAVGSVLLYPLPLALTSADIRNQLLQPCIAKYLPDHQFESGPDEALHRLSSCQPLCLS